MWVGRGVGVSLEFYDTVDYAWNFPTPQMFTELAERYPRSKFILTTLSTSTWWNIVNAKVPDNIVMKKNIDFTDPTVSTPLEAQTAVRQWVFGTELLIEWVYTLRYEEHNAFAPLLLHPSRLLHLNMEAACRETMSLDAALCHFLHIAPSECAHAQAEEHKAAINGTAACDIHAFDGDEGEW